MKTLALAAMVLASAPAFAIDSSGPVNVTVINDTDLKALAAGYASAYSSLSRLVTAVIVRDGERTTLSGIRSIKAQGGVLVIEVGKGALYLVNPRDVLFISDDTANPVVAPK